MTEIQLSPNDRDDLLELLDYALEKKLQEPPEKHGRYTWDSSGYYKLRVFQLKQIIKGKKVYGDVRQSSMGGLIKDIADNLEDETYY